MIIEDERFRFGFAPHIVKVAGENIVLPFVMQPTGISTMDNMHRVPAVIDRSAAYYLDRFVSELMGKRRRYRELAAAVLLMRMIEDCYDPLIMRIEDLVVRSDDDGSVAIGYAMLPLERLTYIGIETPYPTFAAIVDDVRGDARQIIAAIGETEAEALDNLLTITENRLPIGSLAALRQARSLIRVYAKEGRDEKEDALHIDRLIEDAYEARDEIVLCLMGAPGIGKTEAIEKFAERKGVRIVHKILSQVLPSETSGIAMPDRETKSMEVFDDAALASMRDGDILFLDELLKAQQPVLNACLTLVQERRLTSGRKLPDVMIVAAANPLASPTQLPLEIRQRFMFVDVPFSQSGWLAYMDGKGFPNADWLLDDLNVTGRSSEWNCLTPRTATKLCRWMRSTGNSPDVVKYVTDVFGSDVAGHLVKAVAAEREKSDDAKAAEAMLHVASKVMAEKGESDAPSMKRFREIVLDEKDDVDLDKLVAILKDEGIWDKVAAGLSAIKL